MKMPTFAVLWEQDVVKAVALGKLISAWHLSQSLRD